MEVISFDSTIKLLESFGGVGSKNEGNEECYDDEELYNNDDAEFIEALYPILLYSFTDLEEVFIPPNNYYTETGWVFEKIYLHECEAIAAINSEEIWGYKRRSSTSKGSKVFYRCTRVPRTGPQCAAKVYLLYYKGTSSIMLYRAVANHDHISILENLDKAGIMNTKKPRRRWQQSIDALRLKK